MIKGLAHITGGGLTDNIPRILPEGTAVEIEKGSWPVLPVFQAHAADWKRFRSGDVSHIQHGRGHGHRCSQSDAGVVKSHFQDRGEQVYEIGRVIEGERSGPAAVCDSAPLCLLHRVHEAQADHGS